MFTLPEVRGQRVGVALLRQIEGLARDKGDRAAGAGDGRGARLRAGLARLRARRLHAVRRRARLSRFRIFPLLRQEARLMTDLTRLTIAQARDEAAGEGDLRARADRRLSRRRSRPPIPHLNAYVVVTPDKARAMAKASDARLAEGEARRARRHSARHQGPVRHQGRPHPGRQPHPRRLQAALRIDRHRQSVGRRRGHARQAQHGRVRHGLVERDLLLRPGGQSVARARARNADAGARAARRAARPRPSPRGSAPAPPPPTPAARSASRPPSPARSASSRPMAAARAGASSPSPPRSTRPGRSPATCATRDHAEVDGLGRPEGHDLGRPAGAGLRGGDRPIDQGHERRHPEGIPRRRHAGGDRGAVAEGHRLAEGRRRRDRRHLAAAHQICAAGLLHRRAGRGLVQPRPL